MSETDLIIKEFPRETCELFAKIFHFYDLDGLSLSANVRVFGTPLTQTLKVCLTVVLKIHFSIISPYNPYRLPLFMRQKLTSQTTVFIASS